MQMWIHAEKLIDDETNLRSGELSLFIRLGSDVKSNYYEYEIPLELTPPGKYDEDSERSKVWPAANYMDFDLQTLVNLKKERNRAKSAQEPGVGFGTLYRGRDPANELFVKDIIEKREGCLKYFLEQIGDIPYLWIGPPNWKKDTGINEMIARNVKPGCYFKSDGMHFDRTKDGAHPTHASAAQWVDSIARWMPLHSSHPIKMNTPTMAKSRPASVTVLQPLKQPLPMRH